MESSGTLLPCHLLDAPTLKLLQKGLRNVVIYERLVHFLVKNLGHFEGDILLNSNLLIQFLLHHLMRVCI